MTQNVLCRSRQRFVSVARCALPYYFGSAIVRARFRTTKINTHFRARQKFVPFMCELALLPGKGQSSVSQFDWCARILGSDVSSQFRLVCRMPCGQQCACVCVLATQWTLHGRVVLQYPPHTYTNVQYTKIWKRWKRSKKNHICDVFISSAISRPALSGSWGEKGNIAWRREEEKRAKNISGSQNALQRISTHGQRTKRYSIRISHAENTKWKWKSKICIELRTVHWTQAEQI